MGNDNANAGVHQALIDAAKQARQRAYAPYSKFAVGAAVRASSDGSIHLGANVENVSYGLAVCAERHAVAAALAAGKLAGEGTASAACHTLDAVAVVAESSGLLSPCGACRQVLHEFVKPHAPVLLHNLRDGTTEVTTVADLLPMAFAPSALEE